MALTSESIMTRNNFDLLRLFAACQVLFFHTVHHLKYQNDSTVFTAVFKLYSLFPGVPIFFVISGFLVSGSLERNRNNMSYYFGSRFLRIYPGLWGSVLFSLLVLFASGYWVHVPFVSFDFVLWILSQITIVQEFNPWFMRSFGMGAMNGSLWTIPVEVEFYLVLPILYYFIFERFNSRTAQNLLLLTLALCSFVCHVYCSEIDEFFSHAQGALKELVYWPLPVHKQPVGKTVLPYLWMFLVGVTAWRNFDYVRRFVEGKLILWSLIFIGSNVMLTFAASNIAVLDRVREFLTMGLMGLWVLAAAFSIPGLAESVLRGHDISYGIYLYHALLINLAISFGCVGTFLSLVAVWIASLMLGFLSWSAIEKRCLRLKTRFQRGTARFHPRVGL